jgi:hypothetical protein
MMKELLIAAIENTAGWRMQKASEYPDDARNEACANRLPKVLNVVASLPESHPLFGKLALANELNGEGWNEREGQFLSRWGFYRDESAADSGFRFVSSLIEEVDKFLAEQE